MREWSYSSTVIDLDTTASFSIFTFNKLQLLSLKSKSNLSYDLPSVSQSVLVSGHHQGPMTNFLLSMEIILRHLQIFCGAPSLRRGWVCNLFIQATGPCAVTLKSKSCRTRDLIILLHLSLSFLFVSSHDSQGCGGGFYPSSTRVTSGPVLHI
jgi:hypothetical protein